VSSGEQLYNYYMRKIQSQIDSHLVYTGRVSGKQYEWKRAGDVLMVDEHDAPELLAKRIGERSCCGEGLLGNQVFIEIMLEE
jgi:hypothetical protein